MLRPTRRDFLRMGAAGLAAATLARGEDRLRDQVPGERPTQDKSVRVLNPQTRVPVSLIIDDSTCLVNLAQFGMPQFAETWPERAEYKKPWRKMPREIPDAFVRKFGQWCQEQGVKGKYSLVPYPACVGWLDRRLPVAGGEVEHQEVDHDDEEDRGHRLGEAPLHEQLAHERERVEPEERDPRDVDAAAVIVDPEDSTRLARLVSHHALRTPVHPATLSPIPISASQATRRS